jgi:hypothetical protein
MVMLFALAAPASAHSDTGIMTLGALSAEGASTVQATIIYDNDLEPAAGATVTVVGTGPGGATLPETPLPEVGEGVYEAEILFAVAGDWVLVATSTTPASTAQVDVNVPEATGGPSVTDPPTTTSPPTTTTAPDDEDGSDEDDPPAFLFIALGVIVVAGITATVVVLRRR